MDITIRDEKIEDIEQVQNVFYKTWLSTYPNEEAGIGVEDIEERFKNAFSEERIEKRRDHLRNLPENEKVLVALDKSTVVGIARLIRKEAKNQLQSLYVLPEYQGKGIGTRLWQEIRPFADPKKDIYVEVAVYNTKAISFYAKLGFSDTGKRFEEERFKMKSGANIPQMEMIFRI